MSAWIWGKDSLSLSALTVRICPRTDVHAIVSSVKETFPSFLFSPSYSRQEFEIKGGGEGIYTVDDQSRQDCHTALLSTLYTWTTTERHAHFFIFLVVLSEPVSLSCLWVGVCFLFFLALFVLSSSLSALRYEFFVLLCRLLCVSSLLSSEFHVRWAVSFLSCRETFSVRKKGQPKRQFTTETKKMCVCVYQEDLSLAAGLSLQRQKGVLHPQLVQ